MRSVGRVRALAKPQFSLVQSTNASNSPSNSTQRGGSELEKEGRWFRLEALNMSDLILSRRTRLSSLLLSLPPSRALLCNTYKHFEPSCATGFRSWAINKCLVGRERGRHHHDSHRSRRGAWLAVIYRSFRSFRTRASGFPPIPAPIILI